MKLLKCGSAVNAQYAKTALPCVSDLFTVFTLGHWECNINVDHAFSASLLRSSGSCRQGERIRWFQLTFQYLQQRFCQQNGLSNWNLWNKWDSKYFEWVLAKEILMKVQRKKDRLLFVYWLTLEKNLFKKSKVAISKLDVLLSLKCSFDFFFSMYNSWISDLWIEQFLHNF